MFFKSHLFHGFLIKPASENKENNLLNYYAFNVISDRYYPVITFVCWLTKQNKNKNQTNKQQQQKQQQNFPNVCWPLFKRKSYQTIMELKGK